MLRSLFRLAALSLVLAVPAVGQAQLLEFNEYGDSCGPTIDSTYIPIGNGNGVRVSITVTTQRPGAWVVLMVAYDPLNTPLYGGTGLSCSLLVDVIWAQYHHAKKGEYTWTWERSVGDWIGSVFVQFIEYNEVDVTITSSEAVEVTRPEEVVETP